MRRYKRRIRDHAGRAQDDDAAAAKVGDAASYVIAPPGDDDDSGTAGFAPVIVAETTTALRRLSVSEAVQDLDLSGASAIVFRHAGHGRVNVVYRRADGNIGWIDPSASRDTDRG